MKVSFNIPNAIAARAVANFPGVKRKIAAVLDEEGEVITPASEEVVMTPKQMAFKSLQEVVMDWVKQKASGSILAEKGTKTTALDLGNLEIEYKALHETVIEATEA